MATAEVIINDKGEGFLLFEVDDDLDKFFKIEEYEERFRWHLSKNNEVSLHYIDHNIELGYN